MNPGLEHLKGTESWKIQAEGLQYVEEEEEAFYPVSKEFQTIFFHGLYSKTSIKIR